MPLLLMLWLSTVTVVPKGVILVKGATPAASDSSTPLPEQGSVTDGRYRNPYFGLSYPIPAGWNEQPAGPPPSEGGGYVLAEYALVEGQRPKAWVLISAQDLFFGTPAVVTGNAEEVTIADRKFRSVVHVAPRTLTFTFTGTDVAAVRLIIDAEGRVKHVHVLSAFPEQSEPIIAALRMWRFAPYVVDGRGVEVETGMMFGMGRTG